MYPSLSEFSVIYGITGTCLAVSVENIKSQFSGRNLFQEWRECRHRSYLLLGQKSLAFGQEFRRKLVHDRVVRVVAACVVADLLEVRPVKIAN